MFRIKNQTFNFVLSYCECLECRAKKFGSRCQSVHKRGVRGEFLQVHCFNFLQLKPFIDKTWQRLSHIFSILYSFVVFKKTSSNSNMLHPEPGLLVLHTSSSKEKSLQDVEFSQSTSSKLKFKLVTPDCTQSISSKVNALQEEELEQNTSSNCI